MVVVTNLILVVIIVVVDLILVVINLMVLLCARLKSVILKVQKILMMMLRGTPIMEVQNEVHPSVMILLWWM